MCRVSDGIEGHCAEKVRAKKVFPGDPCNDTVQCHYGAQECKSPTLTSQKKCAHLDSTMKCRCTSDCAARHFCSNVDGIKQCMKANEVGGRCCDDEVCVGSALCHFERVGDLSGKCIEFLSLKSGTDLKITLRVKGMDVSSKFWHKE